MIPVGPNASGSPNRLTTLAIATALPSTKKVRPLSVTTSPALPRTRLPKGCGAAPQCRVRSAAGGGSNRIKSPPAGPRPRASQTAHGRRDGRRPEGGGEGKGGESTGEV